jgi:DNA-binding NtrC family response regulator
MAYLTSHTLPVLLVDDEPALLRSVSVVLRTSGIADVLTLEDSRAVLPLLVEQPVGALVLDLTMPGLPGQALLERVAADFPDIPVIVMTATNDLDTAVHCMRMGAVDYLLKPVEGTRLVSALRRALEIRALRAEVLSLKDSLLTPAPYSRKAFADLITQSAAMAAVFRYVEAVAPSPQPVLITGESGTGKELIAGALHRLSGRTGTLVAVNVAGLDDTVLADTLFGHARGAYTGAERARDGLVSSAADGTLFLDEIGDLSALSQVKLLRLLQDGTYYPLGVDLPRQCRARILVATNYDVAERVKAGAFRKDLYYRLRTHHLHLPPLRERREDLPLLVNHLLEKAASALHKPPPTPPLELFRLLKTYSFPGNVRELEAMVFDAVALHRGTTLSLRSFKTAMGAASLLAETSDRPTDATALWPERLPTLDEAEEALIQEALQRADGNQGIAAGILGLSRQALNKRLVRRRERNCASGEEL